MNKIFKGLIRFLIEVIVMTVLIVGINIFAHLFQKCEDTLDLALGVLYKALCLIDVIQNCPVCKEAVKEEICKFQKAALPH